MITGNKVSEVPFTFEDGLYFNLMRNSENCFNAKSVRLNPYSSIKNIATTSESLKAYPNPNNGLIEIYNDELIQSIEIVALEGQLVLSKQINQSKFILSTEEIQSGIYFLKIVDANNKLSVLKFVKN